MTTLEEKFEALESLLGTQNTAINTALDSILTALGAIPSTATTTLDDIATMLSSLNDVLGAMLDYNNGFYAANLEQLGLINTNTDTIITNNSLNAQRTIAAIYATFCDCATDTPLEAPIMDVTPTSLEDEAKCRRIQFYLSVFGNWLNKIANYGASGAAVTGGTLATLLAVAAADAGIVATGVEIGAAGGPPGIVIGAVVGLIAVAAYTFGGSVLIDYANQFADATLRDNMVAAMFAATNADEGYTAFKTTLLAGMDSIPAQLIYTLWWSAWSNDVYSGSPTVDDSAFDGTICGGDTGDCFDVESVTFSGQQYVPFHTISGFEAVLGTDDIYSLDNSFHFSGEMLTGSTTVKFVHYNVGGSTTGDQNFPGENAPAAGRVYVTCADGVPFTCRICILP